jgi:hypothetical protein
MQMQVAILREDGSLVCECDLADVSQEGARLKLSVQPGSPSPSIDSKFVLSLSRRGNLFRKCELIWQKQDEIGLKFIGREKFSPDA